MHAPDQRPRPTPGPRRTTTYWRAVLGLAWRVVVALAALSLVSIAVFAGLFALAHLVVPDWAFIASPFGQIVNGPDDLMLASFYTYFHAPTVEPYVPHGPEIALMWLEYLLSWVWLVIVGSWAINRWRQIEER